MVIVPDKFTFVATPRTGSRALAEALIKQYPQSVTDYPRDHHTDVSMVPADYPIYTVIREPVSHLISWYYHVDARHKNNKRSFDSFVKEYDSPQYFCRYNKYILNPYAEIADNLFVYERGLQLAANAMGIEHTIEVVGKSNMSPIKIDTGTMDYVRQAFAEDFALYESLT